MINFWTLLYKTKASGIISGMMWHVLSPVHIAHSFHVYPEVRHLIHKALPLPNKNPNKRTMVNPPRSSRRPPPQALNEHLKKHEHSAWHHVLHLHDIATLLLHLSPARSLLSLRFEPCDHIWKMSNSCKPTHDMKEVFGPICLYCKFSQDVWDKVLSLRIVTVVCQWSKMWIYDCAFYILKDGKGSSTFGRCMYVCLLEISVSLGMAEVSWAELSECIVRSLEKSHVLSFISIHHNADLPGRHWVYRTNYKVKNKVWLRTPQKNASRTSPQPQPLLDIININ